MGFEWDEQKAETNFKAHGVSFAEAIGVFEDDYAISIIDDESDPDERRFVAIGMGSAMRVLAIVYCYRGSNIRVISARKATAHERQQYEENR